MSNVQMGVESLLSQKNWVDKVWKEASSRQAGELLLWLGGRASLRGASAWSGSRLQVLLGGLDAEPGVHAPV